MSTELIMHRVATIEISEVSNVADSGCRTVRITDEDGVLTLQLFGQSRIVHRSRDDMIRMRDIEQPAEVAPAFCPRCDDYVATIDDGATCARCKLVLP